MYIKLRNSGKSYTERNIYAVPLTSVAPYTSVLVCSKYYKKSSESKKVSVKCSLTMHVFYFSEGKLIPLLTG